MKFDCTGTALGEKLEEMENESLEALETLIQGTGQGSEFRGWLNPSMMDGQGEVQHILKAAKRVRDEVDILVVIGIGGSYLGIRALYEIFKNQYKEERPRLIFAGYHLSAQEMAELMDYLKDRSFAINVISKSGTTTETGLAFRLLRNLLEDQLGKEAAKRRIFVTTDREKGALKTLADDQGYKEFVIPADVGGRFSVLTAVGLFPLAVAGIDIEKILDGAKKAREKYLSFDFKKNPALRYAAARQALYRQGISIEILVTAQPRFRYFQEWWKQLFAESEGKEGKGLYPSSVTITTDLHSLGQWIQQGPRNHMETFLWIENTDKDVRIPFEAGNLDQLNYLEGKGYQEVNHKALLATIQAHQDGGVPCIQMSLKDAGPESIGELIYFFEVAVSVSAYIQGVNPFNQPGVEDYKHNMFKLLGKPGVE